MKKLILILMLGSLFGQDLDSREIIEANNRFAINLYSQYKSEEGNIFFSPFSISTAMAMVYEGAEGKTAKEYCYDLFEIESLNSSTEYVNHSCTCEFLK